MRFLQFLPLLPSARRFRRIEWALLALGSVAVLYLWVSSPPMLEPVLTCVRAEAWAHQGSLLYRYVGAHAGVLLAYVLIPIVAVVFLVLRGDIQLISVPVGLVAAFVLLCGIGHGLEWLASYYPIYWLVANWHALTAWVSLVTWWYLLFHLMPVLLALPSPKQYREALDAAKESARQAGEALAQLEESQESLRTALLETENEREEARKIVKEQAETNEKLHEKTTKVEQQLRTIEQQQEAIRMLSTPVLPILAHTIVAPIIGVFDSSRAEQLMVAILAQISARSASLMILDVTGVPIVDTMVAKELTDIVEAASLMGCRCSITGIKAPVAQALVKLGVSFGPDVRTHTTLQQGMERALAEDATPVRRSGK